MVDELDEKGGALRRLLDDFGKRLDQGERLARLEERQARALDSDDARLILDQARDNDDKTEARFVEKLHAFRDETRGQFRHIETTFDGAIFKANTEQETRIMAAVQAAITAAIANATTPPDQRRTLHPAGVATGGLLGILGTILTGIAIAFANGTLQVHH